MEETLRNINFRTVLPAIVSGVILAFLSSIDNFAITATLGSPAGITVLSTYIYKKAISFQPGELQSSCCTVDFPVPDCFRGHGLQWWVLRKSVIMEATRPDYEPRIILAQGKRRLVEILSVTTLVLVNIVPLLVMFLSSFQVGYSRSALRCQH